MTAQERMQNAIQYSLEKELQESMNGAVIVAKHIGGDKKIEFQNLEEVKFSGKKLKVTISQIFQENNELKKVLSEQQQEINTLKTAITKLADFIDKQRFL